MTNKPFSILKADPEFANRSYNEPELKINTKFDQDRNRILFSKEFRRLQGKTQVFVTGFDDHIRNRLTHTLEVSIIGQTLSKYFGFNETLTEAISLGHDVGHTPFGHVGERTLNFLTNNCDPYRNFKINNSNQKGFKHNWQGLKVVSSLERISTNYKGLNLTDFTLWGILNHSNLKHKKCKYSNNGKCNYIHLNTQCQVINQEFLLNYYNKYNRLFTKQSWTFEALIVNIADEIAQRSHDIVDGIVAGIIDKDELIEKFIELFKDHLILGQKNEIKENNDIFKIINYNTSFIAKDKLFQEYLYNRILNSHLAQSMDGKASFVLKKIIHSYLTNPKQLPDKTIITLFNNLYTEKEFKKIAHNKSVKYLTGKLRDDLDVLHNSYNNDNYVDVLIRTITDFIAGMTDEYAFNQYNLLYSVNRLKNY